MSVKTFLKITHLTWFSKPATDRVVYRAIRRNKVRRILECGVGTGQRAMRMIEMARLDAPIEEISYTGIDLFEARSSADGPGVTLKLAHRLLHGTGAKVRLLPGEIGSALPAMANSLGGTDLVLISARQNPASLDRAWFYVPRIIGASGLVFLEEIQPGGGVAIRQIGLEEIQRLAAVPARRAA